MLMHVSATWYVPSHLGMLRAHFAQLCRGKIMFSPKDPKKTIDGEEVAKRVKAGKRPDELTTCFEGSPLESGYWELITLCWDPQPERRITMRNVLAYYKIDVAVVQVEAVQFVTTSRVNCESSITTPWFTAESYKLS
jgi:hypothetical protein